MAKVTRGEEKKESIVINEIRVGQVTRGNQDIQSWYQAVKSAESTFAPNRKRLYDTYLDISIDLHLKSVMDKRIRAVKTTPFEWEGLENDVLKDNFQSPWFAQLLHYIQERIFYGTTLVEVALSRADNLICDVDLIPRQNVKPEKGIISRDGSSDAGFAYREGQYINYILEIGRANDLGLLANIAPYVLMKRQNLADFSRYNEMFGMPLRVYTYDVNKPNARKEVEQQAEAYGSAAYIVLPKDMGDVRFEDSVKQSTAYAYDKLHEILNNEITIGVLGQLLTTGGEGGGSYELGKVHAAVEQAINLEDRLFAEYLINYKFKNNILIPHGYPLQGIKGKFKTSDAIGKEKKLALWIQLFTSGAPIAEEDFYKEFGILPPGSRPIVVSTNNTGTPPAADQQDDDKDPPAPPKPTGSSHRSLMQGYYQKYKLGKDQARGAVTMSYKSDLDTIIEQLINDVRNGSLKPGDVMPNLVELLSRQLFSAVEKGFGVTLAAAQGTDRLMLEAMQQNIYRFSQFRTYRFVVEANKLLVNDQGNIKAFSDFKRDILALNKEYNLDFLRTEYNHAVATSRMASKWKKFVADEEALPLLQFDAVLDDRTRDSHRSLDGIIRPVGDAFWDKFLPPLDYNCRCTVRQLAEGEVTKINMDELGEPKKGFGVNWGKSNTIFPPTHPQFTVDPEHQNHADNNFGM